MKKQKNKNRKNIGEPKTLDETEDETKKIKINRIPIR